MNFKNLFKEIAVVHLVRAQNGIEPFKHFLCSYQKNPGGIEHDLLILFKGFKSEVKLQEYRLLLVSFKYKELRVPDEGFDITAYFIATRTFEYKYYCFLNSFSVLLDAEWLSKMYQHILTDKVGLVGATGSYQSLYLDSNRKEIFQNAILKSKYPALRKYWIGRIDWYLRYFIQEWRFKPYFGSFPNFHIRTNAFMLSYDVMKKIVCPKIHNKIDAYKFESGKKSITRQVEKLGKTVLVIGKDGRAYQKDDCWKSNTFWRSNQENLLVSDNQTRMYLGCDLKSKAYYSHNAWGSFAFPHAKTLPLK